MFKLVQSSLLKQRKKLYLIVIQFFVGFSALIFALSGIYSLFQFKSDIKNLAPLDAIQIYGSQNSLDDTDEVTTKLYENIVSDLKKSSFIDLVGVFETMDISRTKGWPAKNSYKLIMANSDILHMADINLKKGNKKDILNVNKETGVIPVFVSEALSEKFPLEKTVDIYLYGEAEECYKIKNIGIIDSKMKFWDGGGYPMSETLTADRPYILAPQFIELKHGMSYEMNMLINPKNNKKSDDIIENINKIYEKYDTTAESSSLREQIELVNERQKPVIIFTVSFSILLLLLSILGCTGTIMSSIINRKHEFGIYFSLGFTKKNMLCMVAGEMIVMFLVSYLLSVLVSGTGILLVFKGVDFVINAIVVGGAFCIMLLCMLLCTILPLYKISQLQPIELINGRDK